MSIDGFVEYIEAFVCSSGFYGVVGVIVLPFLTHSPHLQMHSC